MITITCSYGGPVYSHLVRLGYSYRGCFWPTFTVPASVHRELIRAQLAGELSTGRAAQ